MISKANRDHLFGLIYNGKTCAGQGREAERLEKLLDELSVSYKKELIGDYSENVNNVYSYRAHRVS